MPPDPYKGAAGKFYSTQQALNKVAHLLLDDGGVFVPWSAANLPDGFAQLDGAGLLPNSVIPPLAISEVFVVASQAAMLALTAQIGDVAKRTDINQTFMLKQEPPSTLANWIEIADFQTSFLVLNDTPGSYSGSGGKVLVVNQAENALEYRGELFYNHTSGQWEFGADVLMDTGEIALNEGFLYFDDFSSVYMGYISGTPEVLLDTNGSQLRVLGNLEMAGNRIEGVLILEGEPGGMEVYGGPNVGDDLELWANANKGAAFGYIQLTPTLGRLRGGNEFIEVSGGAVKIPTDVPLYFDAGTNSRSVMWQSTDGWFEFAPGFIMLNSGASDDSVIYGGPDSTDDLVIYANKSALDTKLNLQGGSGAVLQAKTNVVLTAETGNVVRMRIGISSPATVAEFSSTGLDMKTHKISNVVDPTLDQDAATKKYVDDQLDSPLPVYRQAAEPTLGADDDSAIWVDTDDSDRTYLVFRRGTGDQVKVEMS